MRRLAQALLVALVTAGACVRGPAAPNRRIVVALASSPINLDPGVGLDESSVRLHQLLFSNLMRIDDQLRVVPDLATRFETTDYQTYVISIPPHVRFHDGREMSAADVAFTFRRFIDPGFSSGWKGGYRDLASVEILDRFTVAFHLKRPSPAFPINLVMGIVPEGSTTLSRRPVGSGPYRLAEFVADDHVTLDAFEDYFRGRPRNDGLVFKTVPDETMRGLELKKGAVDLIVNDLSPDIVHELEQDSRLTVSTRPGTDYAYVAFNCRDRILQDRRVRQAIAYAIDTEAIVRFLRRGLARQTNSIVPSMSWAHADDGLQYRHDPARARALLDEAGYPDPDGDGPAPRLTLTLKTSTAESFRLQAAVIQQQLREVGIALQLRSLEFATLLADVIRGNAQLYSMQFAGITDPDMLRRAFHSAQTPPDGFNRGHYANPEFDRLIDAATAAVDTDERRRLYQAAQRLIADDAPHVPLWAKTNVIVSRRDLTPLVLPPNGDFSAFRDVARTSGGSQAAGRKISE